MDLGTLSGLIGTIVGIAALVLAYWIYRQQTSKIAAYRVIPDSQEYKYLKDILTKRGEKLLLLKLQNIGSLPITKEDFYDGNPIVFEFGKGTEIRQVEVLETDPQSIEDEVKAKLQFNAEKLTIAPLLLNKYTFIKLKVIIARFNGEVSTGKMQIIGGKIVNFDDTFFGKIVLNPQKKPLIGLIHELLPFILLGCVLLIPFLADYLEIHLVASVLGISFSTFANTDIGGMVVIVGLFISFYYS